MNKNDLDFLRADLALAQKSGTKKVMINTDELQALIDRGDKAIDMLANTDADKFKPAGFIVGDHLRNVCDGSVMFAKIKRRKTGLHNTQLYFRDIPGEDTRQKHREEMEAKKLS